MGKERPCDLNQKIKRLRTSRDELKLNNREKTKYNKKLRDSNVEISESRDQWKARSKELNRQKEELEQQISTAKVEIERERMRADKECERANILQTEIDAIMKKNQALEDLIPKMGKKAQRRWYPILMIVMCIRFILEASISFRAAPKAVHIAFSQFAAVKKQRIPSHKTIARWLAQIGLYKLNCLKEQATDWALIVDNSIQIGTKKCLVVLGTRLSKFLGKALTFEDMEILNIEFHENPSAEIICQALEKAQKKVGKASMICADDGPDLRGGIMLFCKRHGVGRVFDIVHKIGTYLKRILEKDSEWQAFTSAAAEAKNRMQQTQAAHLVPPNQRTKSRFLNIEILVHWGIDILVALETPNNPDKELLEQYCGWIRQYKGLIRRLQQFDLISRTTRQYIRENGISNTAGTQVEAILKTKMEFLDFNVEACEYAGKLIDFVCEQAKIVPVCQTWIGSSEVIESLFGKLKCLEHDQSKGGFTSLVLGVAACVGKIDIDVVKAAMGQVSTKDVDKWMNEQMGATILSKRRRSLGSWRKKKKPNNITQESAGICLDEAMGF